MTNMPEDNLLTEPDIRERRIGRRALLRMAALTSLGLCTLSVPGRAFATTAKSRYAKRLIMIDPGHGGIDPGCIGYDGTHEKEITSETAHEVARLLEATGRYKVSLTRSSDVFIPLHERVLLARRAKAELFLSIHADSLPHADMRGASVFTLSETASDELAAKIAAQENSVDLIAGIKFKGQSAEVNDTLLDLMRRETNNLSLAFARDLVANLDKHVAMLPNSQRAAGFAVLKAPDIPSALVEIGCLSNRTEEQDLLKVPYRHKIAAAITRSVDSYFHDAKLT